MKTKRKGSFAIEGVLVAPACIMLGVLAIMFGIFALDYNVYSYTTSEIAQYMNMGDKGYSMYNESPFVFKTDVYNSGASTLFLPDYETEKIVDIETTLTSEGSFEKTFYYFLKHEFKQNKLKLPFCTVNKITCRVYNGSGEVTNFNTSPDTTESGDMIEVTFDCTYAGWIHFVCHGYSFII